MPYEITVVNNDEQENMLALRKNFPEIKIIQTEKNIGFGRGANLGAESSRGEWLLFLNPDTELLSDYAKIISLFEKAPKVGIIGPKLVDENKYVVLSLTSQTGSHLVLVKGYRQSADGHDYLINNPFTLGDDGGENVTLTANEFNQKFTKKAIIAWTP